MRVAIHRESLNYPVCRVSDIAGAKSPEDKAMLRIGGDEWLTHARVCAIGGFSVVVPDTQTEGHIINLYKGLKPVFQRTSDATLVYSPTVPDSRFDQDIINIWHPCERDVTKLFYTTRGREPHVMVEDRTFSGQPDERTVWRGSDIQETYGMYQDAWHRMQKGEMLIDGTWQSMQFVGNKWQIKGPNDSEPPAELSDVPACNGTK